MELTAHREIGHENEDAQLIATGLVIAFYVSAALLFLQGFYF